VLTSYDLLVGLTLLQDRSQQLNDAVLGWNGVLVEVADKHLLVEREALKEIVSLSKATKAIDHRNWLVGLMSYEGAIIPLIELGTLMDEKNPTMGLNDRSVLIISLHGHHFGLLVDSVLGSRDYWSDDTALSNFKSGNQDFCKICFTEKNKIIEVFDTEKLAVAVSLRREVASITQ